MYPNHRIGEKTELVIGELVARRYSNLRGKTLILSIILLMAGFMAGSCSSGIFVGKSAQDNGPAKEHFTLSELRQRVERESTSLGNRDSLRTALQHLNQMQAQDSSTDWMRQQAYRLNFLIATYTVVSNDSSKQLYNRGMTAAAALLKGDLKVMDFINAGPDNAISALPELRKTEYIDAVYWWAMNAIFWYNSEPPVARIVARKKINRAIILIKRNAPEYRYEGVNRLQALLLTISPDGNLIEAQKAFELSIEQAPDYVENRYMYARYYAVLLQDQQLFNTQMNKILAFESSGELPSDIVQLNTLVQARVSDFLDEDTGFFTGKMPVRLHEDFRESN